MSSRHTPVLVVGAGPAGLSASLCLSRLGVDHVVVERHASTAVHPQAHVVNTRTMELFRAWGLAEAVYADSLPLDQYGVRLVETVTGTQLQNLAGVESAMLTPDARAELEQRAVDLRRRHGGPSPVSVTSCAQDRVEAHLLATARRSPHAEIRFSAECTSVATAGDGVTAEIGRRDGTDTITADWLIAADGTRSRTRSQVGIALGDEVVLGTLLNIFVTCPGLIERIHARPALLWFFVVDDMMGSVVNMDGAGRFTVNVVWDPQRETLGDYPPERCARIARTAFGVGSEVDLEVHSVLPWRMTGVIADRYRHERVVIVGDAAHAFPPTGGFGMNSGIQDAHNVAWKIATAVHGWGSDRLVSTYESERRPVAQFNCEQSIRNARGESGADHFFHLGQDLGFRYLSSPAVIPDGSEPPPFAVATYHPSCTPGVRAPHVWLDGDGTLSTLDLFGDRFTLVAAPTEAGRQWCTATASGVPFAALTIGDGGDHPDPSGDWSRLAAIGDDGALLVRPDGHVAWRTTARADDPAATVADVLERIVR